MRHKIIAVVAALTIAIGALGVTNPGTTVDAHINGCSGYFGSYAYGGYHSAWSTCPNHASSHWHRIKIRVQYFFPSYATWQYSPWKPTGTTSWKHTGSGYAVQGQLQYTGY